MGIFLDALRVMAKRPFILWFFGLISLLFAVIDYFNPLYAILFSFSTLNNNGGLSGIISLENIISMIQLLFGQNTLMLLIAVSICLIAAASVLSGLIFSGYLNIVNNALEGKKRFKGEFGSGIKKYFKKVTMMSFLMLLSGFLLALFSAVVIIPAAAVAKAWSSGRSELLLLAALISLVTVFVLFFIGMFFRIYMLFWYPAALNTASQVFTAAKRTADMCFWSLVGRFLLFDVIFVLFQWILIWGRYAVTTQNPGSMPYMLFISAGGWAFSTIFYPTLIVYIFSSFKAHYYTK